MLIVLSGLPGVGKTTIACELVRATGAAYLRIDSIEQGLRAAGWQVEGEGYSVAMPLPRTSTRASRRANRRGRRSEICRGQVDHARQYAARKGWRVAEGHVYIDDGVSGAE